MYWVFGLTGPGWDASDWVGPKYVGGGGPIGCVWWWAGIGPPVVGGAVDEARDCCGAGGGKLGGGCEKRIGNR